MGRYKLHCRKLILSVIKITFLILTCFNSCLNWLQTEIEQKILLMGSHKQNLLFNLSLKPIKTRVKTGENQKGDLYH